MASANKSRFFPTAVLSIAAMLLCGLLFWGAWRFWPGRACTPSYAALLRADGAGVDLDAEGESRIRTFCGDCHAVPRPESFHRDQWHDEVEAGYEYYALSGRTDLAAPPMHQTLAYFRSRAPEQLAYPEPEESPTPFPVSFRREPLDQEPGATLLPGIAGLRWTFLRPDESPVLLAGDMISGRVTALAFHGAQRRVGRVAQLNNPCHVEPCDLDGDGALDLVVADLGSFGAMDHDRGRVVWLRQDGRTGRFQDVVLASGLGRVADVRPIELDPDQPKHLVVAEFGWYRTGKILLLKNAAPRGQVPRFEPEPLDPRTGTIHVPVCDLNGDGRSDFLALVSNESECIEAFLNQGNGKFHRQTLWQAPDLTFGSSGIELVDLDGDGDLDVLYVNGDAFDNNYVSPWHGVQWLENLGNVQFKYHRLTDMPGASVVLAGDFDSDGDQDILAVSFLPAGVKPEAMGARSLPSVVLLAQTARGRFARHTLERGFPCHAAAAVGDFNGDGALDFAVANHTAGLHGESLGRTWLTVWWNQGKGAGSPSPPRPRDDGKPVGGKRLPTP